MASTTTSIPALLVCLLLHSLVGVPAAAAAGAAAKQEVSAESTSAGRHYPSLKACQWPDLDDAVEHLTEIIQFHTVGNATHSDHAEPVVWDLLDLWMRENYHEAFEALRVEKLGAGNLSYLLTWPGSQPDLHPVLFVAHTDVVPVPEETLKDWTHPPFGGVVADGFIWGRGTMDVKVLVVLLMEGVTALLAEGYKPQRTLMIAIGHDEELEGGKGAAIIADDLASRGVTLEMVVDEGSPVSVDGLPPLYSGPVALVSTAEKGYLQLEVTFSSRGGHSSMPPIDGSSIADMLGSFLAAMDNQPAAARLVPPTSDFVQHLARLAPAGVSQALTTASWFAPMKWALTKVLLRAQPETAAMVRTTAAVTRIDSGTADNVLPQTATLLINLRLLPGDTPGDALQMVKGWLGRNAAHANISVVSALPPHIPVADASGPHFAVMKAALQQHWQLDEPGSPAVPVLPLLMPAVTDSRHYMRLSPNGALRFTPWTARKADEDYKRLHGVDERLRVADFACGLNTYKALLKGFGQLGATAAGGAPTAAQEAPHAAEPPRASASGAGSVHTEL